MSEFSIHHRVPAPLTIGDPLAEGGGCTESLTIDRLPLARTLVFAPHPDDESIGTGELLAAAAMRSASIRVVFLTDGENNPWPQRVARRRWRISAEDRASWGRLRRQEAKQALAALGVCTQTASFLGLPDDGLAGLDRHHLVEVIRDILADFDPTLLVIPSIDDFHPDHRAAHRAILRAVMMTHQPLILSYIVHGHATAKYRSFATSADEIARKRSAIGCHSSQLLLSRSRFLRYAARPEQYAVVDSLQVQDETRAATWLAKIRHVLSVFPAAPRR